MILRRLSQNLKQQNWTAIWIEFVLLVAGVFLGIQVSNWNAAQADARLGREYVQRLTRDLRLDLAATSADTAYYSAVMQSVRETDELLRAADPDPRALVVNAYRATEVSFRPTVRATWDQIVSSGHLDLLPTGTIETGLSQYYAFDSGRDVYTQVAGSTYRRTVRKIIPLPLQIAIRAGCSDASDKQGNVVGFAEQCNLVVDPSELKELATALRSDPAVAAELRYQYSLAVSAVNTLGGVKTSLENMLTTLGADSKPVEKVSP